METSAPQYDVNENDNSQPELISAKYIDVTKPLSKMSEMVHKTMTEFAQRYQEYAEDICARMKQAAEAQYKHGFVRKPELRHQYGMLFNHHGYVVSGLKNLELFLSIELPKIMDIQHTPPPFPDCDNWAVAPPSRDNGYITSLGFSTGPSAIRQMENRNMTRFLSEAAHTVVGTQYKHKYQKLLERIDAIKHNIMYKIEKVMPRLLPNEWAVMYGKETMTENNRVKRVIPLGLILFWCKCSRRFDHERYKHME